MRTRIAVILPLSVLLLQPSGEAQTASSAVVGWYNGDRANPRIPGMSNWYLSGAEFGRTYDDFVVPLGGWTVVGAFSNNSLYDTGAITQAAWEIRSGSFRGYGGTVVASGVGRATQTYNPATDDSRIQVDGLQVQLPAGRYWVSVTPAGTARGQSYVSATLGTSAVAVGPGGNPGALYSPAPNSFTGAQSTGQGGTSTHFSQGVLITPGSVQAMPSAAEQWRADLTWLTRQLPQLYSLPFPGIRLDAFQAGAADLYARIPALSDAEVHTGLQALVASIEDPHTDVGWPVPRPFRLLPLSFYWFDDGLYVTGAAAQYEDLLGASLVAVGGSSLDDALGRLTALVPHENDSWAKYEVPLNKLTNTDFLFGTGITPDTSGADIVAETASGDVVSTSVRALSQDEMPRMIPVFHGDPPLYRQHPDRYYWATAIDGGATVYFQYNSCSEDPKQPSADFFRQLDAMLADSTVQRVIVDMRNNTGGFVSILNPWIDEIKASRFNSPGRLYVIVGRATFSAAMFASDRLRQETAAIFVGEPTGGKPRFMNRRGDFGLPYSGIRVSYSNGIMNADDYGPTLAPDIRTGLTFQQYMDGVDPAMDAILRQK